MSQRNCVVNRIEKSKPSTATRASTCASRTNIMAQDGEDESLECDEGADALSIVSSANSSLSSTSSQGSSISPKWSRKQRKAAGVVHGVASSAADVRLRYLRRLGITCDDSSKTHAGLGECCEREKSGGKVSQREKVNDDQSSLSCRLSKTVVFEEPLKHDHRRSLPIHQQQREESGGKEMKRREATRSSSPILPSALSSASSSILSTSSHSDSASSGSKKKVSFNSTVSVKPIPMRTEYSDRIRCHLWSSRREMVECVQRNSLEFASENYDWRQVAEDADMLVCTETGALIHPIHYFHYLQQQAQPSMISGEEGMYHSKSNRNRGNISFFQMSQHASMEWIN